MPRPLRIQAAGAIYHVMARGNRRQEIYVERGDYERFLTICADVVDRSGWRCHGYCLMPNHYHLVIETPDANLSAGIQRLNGRYAQRFNWWHGLDGHLFQGRFQAVLLERTWHLVELVRYLALNPVRAGLCPRASDWPWSSYRALAGLAPRPPFLSLEPFVDEFGPDPRSARDRVRAFVEDAPEPAHA
jgi:putative transposase